MCSIAGLVYFQDNCLESTHQSMIKQINSIQSHSGPDDNSIVKLGKIWLGSTCLSILDLSLAGHMPMSNSRGNGSLTRILHTYSTALRSFGPS